MNEKVIILIELIIKDRLNILLIYLMDLWAVNNLSIKNQVIPIHIHILMMSILINLVKLIIASSLNLNRKYLNSDIPKVLANKDILNIIIQATLIKTMLK